MKSPAVQLVMSLLMETMRTESLRPAGIRELPIVAGNLALDFANTVDDPLGPQRFDHVADYQSLAAWSQRIGTVSAQSSATLLHIAEDHPRHAESTVRRGKDLRAAINETFGAVVEGHSPDTGWRQLRPFVAEAIQHAGVMSSSPQLVACLGFVGVGLAALAGGRGGLSAAHWSGDATAQTMCRLPLAVR